MPADKKPGRYDSSALKAGKKAQALRKSLVDDLVTLAVPLLRLGIDPVNVLRERLADEDRARQHRLDEKSAASVRAAELRRHVRAETGNVNESLKVLAKKYGTSPPALRKQIERAREVHPGDPFTFLIPRTKSPAPAALNALLDAAERRVAAEKSATPANVAETAPTLINEGGFKAHEKRRRRGAPAPLADKPNSLGTRAETANAAGDALARRRTNVRQAERKSRGLRPAGLEALDRKPQAKEHRRPRPRPRRVRRKRRD